MTAIIRRVASSCLTVTSPSSGDLCFFGQLVPGWLPLGQREADRGGQFLHLVVEGLADLVVVPELEAELPVERVLGRAGPAEDVHGPDVPLAERRLGLAPRGRVLGQPLDPVLAVPDVELLLLEDPLDGPHPGAVGAAADVLELVAGPAVHAEVEEHEVGPGLDRGVEDVDALLATDPGGPDVGGRLDPP